MYIYLGRLQVRHPPLHGAAMLRLPSHPQHRGWRVLQSRHCSGWHPVLVGLLCGPRQICSSIQNERVRMPNIVTPENADMPRSRRTQEGACELAISDIWPRACVSPRQEKRTHAAPRNGSRTIDVPNPNVHAAARRHSHAHSTYVHEHSRGLFLLSRKGVGLHDAHQQAAG